MILLNTSTETDFFAQPRAWETFCLLWCIFEMGDILY